jgi:hypothetical protein
MPPALFALSYFPDRVSHFWSVASLRLHSSTYVSQIAGITDACYYMKLVGCDGVWIPFCLGWPQTTIHLISAAGDHNPPLLDHHIIILNQDVLSCWELVTHACNPRY